MFGIMKKNQEKPSDLEKYIYDEYLRVQKLQEAFDEAKKTIAEKDNKIKEYEAMRVVVLEGERRIRSKDNEIDRLNSSSSAKDKEIERLKQEIGRHVFDKSQLQEKISPFESEIRQLKYELDKKYEATNAEISKAVSDATPQIEKEFLDLIICKIEELPNQTRKSGVLEMVRHIMEVTE